MEIYTIKSVVRQRVLDLVRGQDGRVLDSLVLARLQELQAIVTALGLEEEAARLSKLVAIAEKGHCHDLTRAALSCLIEERSPFLEAKRGSTHDV
jgi:hypothetical protein